MAAQRSCCAPSRPKDCCAAMRPSWCPTFHVGLIASRDTEVPRLPGPTDRRAGLDSAPPGVKVPVQAPALASIACASPCSAAVIATSSPWCAAAARRTWPLSRRSSWPGRSALYSSRCSPGSATPATTVADIVAARACITPTECGQAIVVRTRQWWAAIVAACALPGSTGARLPRRCAGVDGGARGRLTAAARHQLRIHHDHLAVCAAAAARSAPTRVAERRRACGPRRSPGPAGLGSALHPR